VASGLVCGDLIYVLLRYVRVLGRIAYPLIRKDCYLRSSDVTARRCIRTQKHLLALAPFMFPLANSLRISLAEAYHQS